MIRFARVVALFGSGWTLVCAGLMFMTQLAGELRGDSWEDFSVGSVLAKVTGEGSVYRTASERVGSQTTFLQSGLDLPVVVPLLAVAALQIAFYLWLRLRFDPRDNV
jgi:hypothetical protein